MNQAESLEIREQMEEDSDLEFQMMQQNYEKRLCSEKETYLILKGESGIMKKQVRIWYPQGRVGHHEETGEDLVPSREESGIMKKQVRIWYPAGKKGRGGKVIHARVRMQFLYRQVFIKSPAWMRYIV